MGLFCVLKRIMKTTCELLIIIHASLYPSTLHVLNNFLNVPSFLEAPSFADSAKANILFKPVLDTAAAAAADCAIAPLPRAAALAIISSLLTTLIRAAVGVGGVDDVEDVGTLTIDACGTTLEGN